MELQPGSYSLSFTVRIDSGADRNAYDINVYNAAGNSVAYVCC